MPYSLYLHIPFCRHRCAYCDFNTYAGLEALIPAYVRALAREIEWVGKSAPAPLEVHTLYFGGGTPSLLSPEALEHILQACSRVFSILPDAEISLEANPGTVTLDWLRTVRRLGINRLSLGMQSAHPDDLRLLERQHDFLDVSQAVRWARRSGFDNISLDLIFGLPFQTMQRWKETLERALGLHPEHLSLYALSIEHATPFFHWAQRGLIPWPDDDLAAEMYEWADERLTQAGYTQYEISNWAATREGRLLACRHNLQYWYNEPYLGFGAGAHGFVAGFRTINLRGVRTYLERLQGDTVFSFPFSPANEQVLPVDRQTEMEETMLVGLRLVLEGVDRQRFHRRFGQCPEEVFGSTLNHLATLGLVECFDGRWRLTRRGRLLGNQVFIHFVGERSR